MEKLLKALDVHRTSFSRLYEETVILMEKPDYDVTDIQGNARVMDQKMEIIAELDKQILDLMLEDDSHETDIDSEVARADELSTRYNRLKAKLEKCLNKDSLSDSSNHSSSNQIKRKVKLPQIELKKFGGEIKDWLSFWGQFSRIHNDALIQNEDKFQYLIQATVPNSRARQLVESYPPTSDNYSKAIESLKSRFGREDLLVEVYIRELLKLILNNLNFKAKLGSLYDMLESHLRSLDSLGVKSDKCAAMLYPLVESCLPENILRVWQRSTIYDSSHSLAIRLDKLMDFLRKEVENEDKISLAMSGFGLHDRRKIEANSSRNPSIPTASGLVNQNKIPKCVFCKKPHPSIECDDNETKKLSFDEKKKVLVENGRCYLCLKFGHIARKCAVKCICSHCKGKHATLMCRKYINDDEANSNTNSATEKSVTIENLSNNTFDQTYLQTLVVTLCSKNKSRLVRVLIDTGSQRSYISKYAAIEMGYDTVGSEKIIHALFGGSFSDTVDHNCYRVTLKNLNGKYICNFSALDQAVICGRIISLQKGPWKAELSEIGVAVTDTQDGPIEILLGADVAGKLLTGKRHVLQCGLVAVETSLGWTLMGRVSNNDQTTFRSSSMIITPMFSTYDISHLWNLDILGISEPKEKKSNKENQTEIMRKFSESVTVNSEGRYEVGLTWVDDHPPLANNFVSARKRLDNLMIKLDSDGYYDAYNQVLHDWLGEGIIEEVSEQEIDKEGYYLPHRHVVKLSSATTKLRPVFDASAKERDQPSLNQCLEKGINLIELIPSILTRFRFSRIGVVSDIKKAFLQISLKNEDRNFLRFLWFDEHHNLKFYRHKRVVFGVNCSPFLLAAVINHHLQVTLWNHEQKFSQSIISKLMNSFYVDNCVTSVNNEEELNQFITESTEVMKIAKFELRGWEYSALGNEKDLIEVSLSPVLGLNWNRKSDTLEINFDWLKNIDVAKVTKRLILSIAHRLFDPIGFSCPVQICPRILLQKTWLLKLKWDVQVPDDIGNEFLIWLKDLQFLSQLRIPRWLMKTQTDKLSLHMFCDSSKDAYAAVVFLRAQSTDGIHVQLIQAKSRISPTKKITIPRLELLAANIGARLLSSVLEYMGILNIEIFCWSDSTTVLSWIRQEDYWKPFVWNRIQEIRSLTGKHCWYHVPGEMNPADLPSRGCSPKQLLFSRWWEGPSWLINECDWPQQKFDVNENEILEERRKVLTLLTIKQDFSRFYYYFSKYQKILNQMGWIKRFIYNCLHSKKKRKGLLSLEEIAESEIILIKMVQNESFISIDDKSLSSLHPFRDNEGVIRIKSKISERDDIQDFLYPILLPSKHPITERIVLHYHLEAFHLGIQGLLCRLRERFWIIKARKTIRTVIARCFICQRFNSKKADTSSIALPGDRVRDAAVFEVVGIDLAGPLFLRTKEKVWICIFTCAVYRAVHLEIVCSMSTDSFLLAFRRFIARRGRPSVIYSDNGGNFVGTENCLKVIDWKRIEEESIVQRIKWKFNPPAAPWWGGWWERLIRILKQLLRKQLGRACLSYEELHSMICECEAIMNSRPLTYVTENTEDLIPLTPNMFLQEVKEIGTTDLDEIDATAMNRHLKYIQRMRQSLRKRFREEYLAGLLLTRNKHNSKNFKVGDVVMIESENFKRLNWPLGVIEEVFPGKDGIVRLVRLRTATGKLMRPIQRLYPMELELQPNSSDLKEQILSAKRKQKQRDTSKPNTVDETEICRDVPEPLDEEANSTTTRYGRRIKVPSRLTY